MECVDPLGEHIAGARPYLDTAMEAAVLIGLWLAANPFVFGKPAHSRAWSTRAMLGEELWITRPLCEWR